MVSTGTLSNVRRQGFGRREPRRFGLVFLMAVSFLMVLFSLYGAQASVFEKARESVLDAFEPVLTVIGAPVRWTGRRVGDVQDYFRLAAENERLRQENDELRAWMNEAISLRNRLAYYETVLDTKLPPPATYVDAAVIGENGGPFQKALILSAGAGAGVRPGSAVVDDGGLLGHVVTAGEGASRVLLVTDYNARTPVLVEGVGAEALMVGRGGSRTLIQFFADPPQDPVPVGTRIVTSGAGGILPRGIPVGTVTGATREGLQVRLYADTAAADLVRVVDYDFPKVEPEAEASALAEAVTGG
jgi:rod shape-determining protein MreC